MKTKQNSKQTKKPTHINAKYNIRLENTYQFWCNNFLTTIIFWDFKGVINGFEHNTYFYAGRLSILCPEFPVHHSPNCTSGKDQG